MAGRTATRGRAATPTPTRRPCRKKVARGSSGGEMGTNAGTATGGGSHPATIPNKEAGQETGQDGDLQGDVDPLGLECSSKGELAGQKGSDPPSRRPPAFAAAATAGAGEVSDRRRHGCPAGTSGSTWSPR